MLRFACLTAGVVPASQDECAYLELGFGRGLAISIHASNAGQFWGNDFNQIMSHMRGHWLRPPTRNPTAVLG